jgi:hypothetical protein
MTRSIAFSKLRVQCLVLSSAILSLNLIHLDSRAAISYTTAGANYTQTFDSLPNMPENTSLGDSPIGWKNDDTAPPSGNFSIEGWYLLHPLTPAQPTDGGFNTNQRLRVGAGTATTGAFMSFGVSGSTERALGMVNSNTLTGTTATSLPAFYGAKLINDTGTTLTQFTLSYNGEQWRDGGAMSPAVSVQQRITFDYSFDAASIQDTMATRVAVPALEFAGPIFGATTAAAVDGNVAGRVAIAPVTVSNINWQPGGNLWIRWSDKNDAGNDHGLAIDDVVFSASAGAVVGTQGDYNGNGVVDSADYALWRNGGPLQNEVDNVGTVNDVDYTEWRARFGNGGPGAGSVSGGSVPEPGTVLLLMSGCGLASLLRRRQN